MISMAKFRKLLFGSIIGAGLAYIFTRKDVRQRLMGGGRPQLPPTTGAYMGAGAAPAQATLDMGVEEATVEEEVEAVTAPFEAEEQVEAAEMPTEAPADVAEAPEVLLEEEAAPEVEPAMEAAPEEIEVVEPAMEAAPEEAEPVVEEPVLEAEKTITETAEADEFAALKTPIEGEPSMEEQPAMEEPSEAAAGGPAPSQIDRDEMRRRIDETRARLKAKAFDAMMSGESFTETEGDELKQRPEEGGLDEELENQIDRSLKEQD